MTDKQKPLEIILPKDVFRNLNRAIEHEYGLNLPQLAEETPAGLTGLTVGIYLTRYYISILA